jgi:hypothetical protein
MYVLLIKTKKHVELKEKRSTLVCVDVHMHVHARAYMLRIHS